MEINYNIPVSLFDFKEKKDSLYSSAKLKIFYVGTTGDKRTFTQEFSDKLLKTLPYVPVVGYFNKEKEDFEGHKTEVQYIYGIIPENTKIEYIEEDSKKYAVSDVILYTGRLDETGTVAKQIVGKSHSLELNPKDTKYKINKDAKGNFIDIEFTEGSLLGLSVLGDDEKPAFSGSEFFTDNEELEIIFTNLKSFAKQLRGEKMETTRFQSLSEFIKKSYNEQAMEINELLKDILGEMLYIDQLFDDNVVVYFLDANWEEHVVRINYTKTDDGYEFDTPVEVIKRYFTEAELENIEGNFTEIEPENDTVEESIESTEDTELEDEGAREPLENTEEAQMEELTGGLNESNEEEAHEDDVEGTEDANSVALAESERGELETLRKKEEQIKALMAEMDVLSEELNEYKRRDKKELISSFSDSLGRAFIENLTKRVDEFTQEELENVLSKEYVRLAKEGSQKGGTIMPFASNKDSQQQETREDLVRRLVGLYK